MFAPTTDETPHPLGFLENVTRGWEQAYSERWWPDLPSLDETIEAGWGFCAAWGAGRFRKGLDTPHPVGYYHNAGSTIYCHPRGPGAFTQFDHLFPDKLEGWVKATRARTDACRKHGQESAIFLGLPHAHAFGGLTHGQVGTVLKRWTAPIIEAGFDRVQLDSSGAVSTYSPQTALEWAQYMLEEGLRVDVETTEVVTPSAFPWFNGRFGVVEMPEARVARSGPGWFNASCPGVAVRRFLWLQGSIPTADRIEAVRRELSDPTGSTPIVEVGGCWDEMRGLNPVPPSPFPPERVASRVGPG